MNLFAFPRQPVRISQAVASLCESRGFCGPFVNEEYYNAFPEPFWHGMGDCLCCGSTRMVDGGLLQAPQIRTAA